MTAKFFPTLAKLILTATLHFPLLMVMLLTSEPCQPSVPSYQSGYCAVEVLCLIGTWCFEFLHLLHLHIGYMGSLDSFAGAVAACSKKEMRCSCDSRMSSLIYNFHFLLYILLHKINNMDIRCVMT